MQKIHERVYRQTFMGGFTNVYLLIADDGSLVLIDTGADASIVPTLDRELPKIGFAWEQIRHVFITHGHYDHVGGLAAIQQRLPNAQTVVGAADAGLISKTDPQPMASPATLPLSDRLMLQIFKGQTNNYDAARVDRPVQAGEVLDDIVRGLEVIDLHGHSWGQVGYYLPDERILFAGDVVMRMPWGYTRPIRSVSPDWNAVHESIARVVALAPQLFCIGHGAPYVGNVADVLRDKWR